MQHMRVRRGFFSGYSQQTARKMVKRLVPDSVRVRTCSICIMLLETLAVLTQVYYW